MVVEEEDDDSTTTGKGVNMGVPVLPDDGRTRRREAGVVALSADWDDDNNNVCCVTPPPPTLCRGGRGTSDGVFHNDDDGDGDNIDGDVVCG